MIDMSGWWVTFLMGVLIGLSLCMVVLGVFGVFGTTVESTGLDTCEHDWERWQEPQQRGGEILQFRRCSKCAIYESRQV